MVSYIKTQWWRLVCAAGSLIYSVVIAFTSTATADTLEGMYELVGDLANFSTWILASILWCVMSFVDHNSECIKELNKRISALEEKNNGN